MKRLNFSFTAKVEGIILNKIVKVLPDWVTPDLLTLLAFLAAIGGYVFYLLSANNLIFLWGVNLCLLIHWFGDSLDGKLARFRKDERPKYGFYVDHMLDAVSAALFLGGLTSSALTLTSAWIWILALMLLCMVHVFLKSKVSGVFELSIGPAGPTESRILLFLVNVFIIYSGNPSLFIIIPLTLLDIIGWIGVGIFLLLLIPEIVKTTISLNKTDRSS